MTQEFNGPVHGDVAGRDVVYETPSSVRGINLSGNASVGQIIHGPIEPVSQAPESQLQAEFYRHTGIWCPREARELFEDLMKNNAFTARELAVSWRANSLRWEDEAKKVSIVVPMLEAVSGWAMVGVMLIYFLTQAVPLIFAKGGLENMTAFAAGVVMYLGSAWMVARFILWPRRVAMRVRRALARRSTYHSESRRA
ncbi:hypothetical protein [Aromatoleum evansii]|uniref:hypothetical protein n=1 Tax=Aromatoleum evansii TaxID=59406 RepID=UPI00145D2EBB|nr:hypothetical protein [Aromatoleum evansii]NMG29336.1 hypothetical protein [Aromatoleum evansii]